MTLELNKWYYRETESEKYYFRPIHYWTRQNEMCFAEVFRLEQIKKHYFHEFYINPPNTKIDNKPVSQKEIDDIKVKLL